MNQALVCITDNQSGMKNILHRPQYGYIVSAICGNSCISLHHKHNICSVSRLGAHRLLTPFTPFFNLSSMNSERYSGDLGFRLRKCSKSDAIICLNILSLLNELWRKWSNLSLRSSRFCNK